MVSQSAFWLRLVAYLIAMAHQDSFPIDAAIEAQVLGLAQTASSAETQLALPADERVVRRSYWTDRGFSDDLALQGLERASTGTKFAIGSRTAWRKHYPLRVPKRRDDSGAFFLSGDEGPALRAGERVHVLVLRKWVLAGRSNRGRQNPAAGALSHKRAEHLENGGRPVGRSTKRHLVTATTMTNHSGAHIRCYVSPSGKAHIDALEEEQGEPLRANPSGLCTSRPHRAACTFAVHRWAKVPATLATQGTKGRRRNPSQLAAAFQGLHLVPCSILTASQTLVPGLIGILTLQCPRYCRPALARSAFAARHTRAGGATQAFPGKCYDDDTFYMKRLPQCIFGSGNDSSQGGLSSHACSPAPVR